MEEKLLYELEHHSFRKYSENYFKQYFATPEEIGRSKRKRVVNAKIVNIYSTYKNVCYVAHFTSKRDSKIKNSTGIFTK